MFCVTKYDILLMFFLLSMPLPIVALGIGDNATGGDETGKAEEVELSAKEEAELNDGEATLGGILAHVQCHTLTETHKQQLCQKTLSFAADIKREIEELKGNGQPLSELNYGPRLSALLKEVLAPTPAELDASEPVAEGKEQERKKWKSKLKALLGKMDGKSPKISKQEAQTFLVDFEKRLQATEKNGGSSLSSRPKRGIKTTILAWGTGGIIGGIICLLSVGCIVGVVIIIVLLILIFVLGSPLFLILMHQNGGIRGNIKDLFSK